MLVLVGGGGHCRSVIEAATSAGIPIAGILDLPHLLGTEVMGVPVIGNDDDIEALANGHTTVNGIPGPFQFIVTVGFIEKPDLRIKLYDRILAAGGKLATVIAKSANVSQWAQIGPGTVVLHGACVNAGASVGANAIINTLANVDHDASVGDHTHVSTGAMLNGAVSVGKGCFIGSGAVVYQGTSIADGCIVAGGGVVHKNLTTAGVYAGYPLRKLS